MSTILHVLQHALGRDEHGQRRRGAADDYRNHYCAGEGHHSFALCRQAVAEGLMVEHPPKAIFGGDCIFVVTEKGKAYVAEHSPKPPKVSAGKQRYQRWLDVSDAYDISFCEWLRRGYYKAAP